MFIPSDGRRKSRNKPRRLASELRNRRIEMNVVQIIITVEPQEKETAIKVVNRALKNAEENNEIETAFNVQVLDEKK